MEFAVTLKHHQLHMKSSFEEFTERLEKKVLNHLEVDWAGRLKTDPSNFENYIKQVAGGTGLMIFQIQDHGALLGITGKPRKVRQYVIGNPITAVEMTQHDVRASLYAPLRLLVFEDEEHDVLVEYDLPSSIFAQFGNKRILEVAKSLDSKILNIINLADAPN